MLTPASSSPPIAGKPADSPRRSICHAPPAATRPVCRRAGRIVQLRKEHFLSLPVTNLLSLALQRHQYTRNHLSRPASSSCQRPQVAAEQGRSHIIQRKPLNSHKCMSSCVKKHIILPPEKPRTVCCCDFLISRTPSSSPYRLRALLLPLHQKMIGLQGMDKIVYSRSFKPSSLR